MWQPPQRFVVTFWQCPQFVGTAGRSFAPTPHSGFISTAARDAITNPYAMKDSNETEEEFCWEAGTQIHNLCFLHTFSFQFVPETFSGRLRNN